MITARVASSNLPVTLVSKPRPLRRRCTSRRWLLSRPLWSSLVWVASSVKVAGSMPVVKLRVVVDGPFCSSSPVKADEVVARTLRFLVIGGAAGAGGVGGGEVGGGG